jgi:hypothetical protein
MKRIYIFELAACIHEFIIAVLPNIKYQLESKLFISNVRKKIKIPNTQWAKCVYSKMVRKF